MKFWHEVHGRLGHLSYHVEHSSPAAAPLTRPLSGHCFEELIPVSLHLLAHVLERILHGGGLGLARLWSELSAGDAIHCVWASLEPSRTQTRHFTTDCLGQALLNINTPSYWSAEHILALWLDSRWLIVLPSEVCDVMLIIFCETFSMDAIRYVSIKKTHLLGVGNMLHQLGLGPWRHYNFITDDRQSAAA